MRSHPPASSPLPSSFEQQLLSLGELPLSALVSPHPDEKTTKTIDMHGLTDAKRLEADIRQYQCLTSQPRTPAVWTLYADTWSRCFRSCTRSSPGRRPLLQLAGLGSRATTTARLRLGGLLGAGAVLNGRCSRCLPQCHALPFPRDCTEPLVSLCAGRYKVRGFAGASSELAARSRCSSVRLSSSPVALFLGRLALRQRDVLPSTGSTSTQRGLPLGAGPVSPSPSEGLDQPRVLSAPGRTAAPQDGRLRRESRSNDLELTS